MNSFVRSVSVLVLSLVGLTQAASAQQGSAPSASAPDAIPSGGAAPLRAERLSLRVAGGAVFPNAEAAQRRDAGPAAMLSAEYRLSHLWSLRADGEWSLLRGPPAPAGQEGSWAHHDLRTHGVSLNAVMRFTDGPLVPYVLTGIGAYRLQFVGGSPSPYGTTGALQVGLGADANFGGRINPFIEARAQVHLTDYGSTDYGITRVTPVMAGVRIR
jgi:hypothetical protein